MSKLTEQLDEVEGKKEGVEKQIRQIDSQMQQLTNSKQQLSVEFFRLEGEERALRRLIKEEGKDVADKLA